MKAVVFRNYGSPEVLQIEETPKPHPGPSQILVKNYATAVTAADCRIRGANFPKGFVLLAKLVFGLFKPFTKVQILGTTFSGVIEEVGSQVSQFKKGDAVFGMKTPPHMGTYVQYLVVDENSAVAHKPNLISHQDAAGMLFGGTTALYFLRDRAGLKKGETILIIGASGAVGTNAVQLAKYYGAKITAVCSTKNLKLVKSLGADEVIDYTHEDVAKLGTFDVVFNAAPGLDFDDLAALVKPDGRVLLVLTDLWGLLQAKLPWLRKKSSRNIQFLDGIAPELKADVLFLAERVLKKDLKVIIAHEYSLSQIVDAHRHADTGHKVGNIVIKMQ